MDLSLLAECTGFDWDKNNLNKNAKHKVEWTECEEVFFLLPLIMGSNNTHSNKEKRYYVLGQTKVNRKLFIAFTIKNNKIRVISARDMTQNETTIYEEK